MPTRDQMNRAAEPMRLALPGPVIPTDPRDAEIARLGALVAELLGNVDELTAQLSAAKGRVLVLRHIIADLRGQLMPHQRPAQCR